MTSSNTSSAPDSSHAPRRPSRKPAARRDEAHVRGDRLDDHTRDVVVELWHLVVGSDDRLRDGQVGHACRARQPERRDPAPPGREQRVAVPVVVAGELHHLVSARVAAGDAQHRHRGLGAAVDHAHALAARHPFADRLCEQHFARRRRSVRRAVTGRVAHRLDDLRVRVAQDDRAVALHEVRVALAFDIPDVPALGALHEVGVATDRAERADRRVHPARDHRLRALEPRCVACHLTAIRRARGRGR